MSAAPAPHQPFVPPDQSPPELTWAPDTWGRNHAATVAAHLGHAETLGYQEWGFSPCARPSARPERGYAEFGVPPIAAGHVTGQVLSVSGGYSMVG